ncbi:tyrosine/serine/threonine protein phosphatase pps1 [Serendipita sp. 405]|nr:tyrosine/serine/threonine protein phosphatase pps1 [Serendipita sp. 405]
MTRSAFALAERFKHAIEAKARERERTSKGEVVHYNVFVVTDHFSEFEVNYPHLVAWDSKGIPSNWNDFAIREREEICNLTQATEVCDGLWVCAHTFRSDDHTNAVPSSETQMTCQTIKMLS